MDSEFVTVDTVVKTTKKKHQCVSFNHHIRRLFKKLHPDMSISNDALNQINVFLKHIDTTIIGTSLYILQSTEKQTLTWQFLEETLSLYLERDFFDRTIVFCKRILEAQESESKHEFSLPMHLSEKLLRNGNKYNLSNATIVYLTAFNEFILTEIFAESVAVAQDFKRKTITVRHVLLGTQDKPELSALLKTFNINWVGGGVLPEINEILLPDKKKQRQSARKRREKRELDGEAPLEKGRQRVLPGTKSLQDIRKYQKSFDLLSRKEHFKRLFKEQADVLWGENDKVHFGSGVFEILQSIIEERVVYIYSKAVLTMIHAKRSAMDASDIELVWDFLKPSGVETFTNAGIENLTEPGLHRLASRGGVKRLGTNCYPVIKQLIGTISSRILHCTFICMKRNNVKTMTLYHLHKGCHLAGFNITTDKTKRIRAKKTVKKTTVADESSSSSSETDIESEHESSEEFSEKIDE